MIFRLLKLVFIYCGSLKKKTMSGKSKIIFMSCLATLASFFSLQAQTVNEWRGSGRTGIYPESSLLKTWPSSGPSLLWESMEAGNGFSSVTVTDDAVYITGRKGSDDYLTAFTQGGETSLVDPLRKGL